MPVSHLLRISRHVELESAEGAKAAGQKRGVEGGGAQGGGESAGERGGATGAGSRSPHSPSSAAQDAASSAAVALRVKTTRGAFARPLSACYAHFGVRAWQKRAGVW